MSILDIRPTNEYWNMKKRFYKNSNYDWRKELKMLWKHSWKKASKMGRGFVSDEVDEYFIGNLPQYENFISSLLSTARQEERKEVKKMLWIIINKLHRYKCGKHKKLHTLLSSLQDKES